MQVPPDFYIPDFDEDEQNPDERMDRKWNSRNCVLKPVVRFTVDRVVARTLAHFLPHSVFC